MGATNIHCKLHPKIMVIRPVVYPLGKPMAPQLLRCKGFAVKYYSFTLYASDLQHPRLLQH